MTAKRHQIFIGTGLVAALSCGLAPLPAAASTIPDSSVRVAASDINAVADLTLTQTVTPSLKPGQAGDATVRVTNNSETSTPRGAKFQVTAPAGTTFTKSSLTYTYPTGWATTTNGTLSADKKTLTVTFGADAGMSLAKNGEYVDIKASIQSDANNTRAGVIADGKLAVVEGPAFPVGTNVAFGYTADYAALTLAQTVAPTLKPGQAGDATVRVTNNAATNTPRGATFQVTAPAGTTFTESSLTYTYPTTGWGTTTNGTLSADKKTLTVTFGADAGMALDKDGGYVDITASIVSDADNTRSGLIADGKLAVVQGPAFPVGTNVALGYTADHEALTLVQTVAPTLKPGQAGDATVRVTNNTATTTPRGAKFEVTAPAGTTFTESSLTYTYPSGWATTTAGILSADKKTLTVTFGDDAGMTLAKNGEHVDITASIVSDADNTRAGVIADGKLAVVEGPAFPVGTNVAFGYTAENVAKPVILDAPAFDASVIDTNRPVFSGTGQPGAEITVKGVTRVIATTTVKADGTWSVPASFDLANGGYAGTVTQSSDGSSASFKFGIKFGIPVTLTAPAQEATLQPGKPVFSGKGQPGASVEVRGQFGTLLGTTTVGADGNWSVESLVALGVADYRGTAVQKSSQDTTSASFQFSVKKDEVEVTPVVLTSPAIDAELEAGKPVFAGTGHPGATVMVQGAYGTVLGTTVVETDGSWSVESTVSLVAGAYSGSAKQTVEGKQSASPFKFTAK